MSDYSDRFLTHDAVEEGSSQMPVVLVIEECDHVRQQDVVGFLTSEKDAETRDSIFHQRLFDDVLGVAQQCHHLLLHHLMQRLQLCNTQPASLSHRYSLLNICSVRLSLCVFMYLNRSFRWGEAFPLRPHRSGPALCSRCFPERAPRNGARSLPGGLCSLNVTDYSSVNTEVWTQVQMSEFEQFINDKNHFT